MNSTDLAVRVYRAARFGWREIGKWRELSGSLGIKRALMERIRQNLDLGGVDAARLERIEEELARARSDEPARASSDEPAPRETKRGGPRILAFNSMFPLITETYIYEELMALEEAGAEVAFARQHRSAAPMRIPHAVHEGLEAGVAAHRPELIFIHWANFASFELARLEKLGVPFAVRAHSFDFEPQRVRALLAHPLCAGVWAYPHHAPLAPGARALPSMLHTQLPWPSARRDLVLSVSAGLPKKNWPLLTSALSQIAGVDRRIVLGITNEHESVPSRVAQMLAQHRDPPLLQVNLERAEVFRLLSRAAVMIYTLEGAQPFGQPMSIVEAMAAGASVIAPDRPEARELIGAGFRGYSDEASLVAQIREALAGGPRVEAERGENRKRARSLFCDRSLRSNFASEVFESIRARQNSPPRAA